ncbi:site-specific integrase, partial [Streptococcus agalactiae]|nr:site-specific integrase [Streptococcus agalactiae]
NELLALTIDDLDFMTNEIIVSKTLVWKAGNKNKGIKGEMICKQSPKSDSGNRRVLVPKEILNGLKDFHQEMNNYFEDHRLPTTKLIFPTIYGNYMTDRNERATLIKRLREAGLPSYGFHIFRHTHASLLLNAGTNWKELQERMGHKSITSTMDTYAELAPHKKFEAVDTFQSKLEELANKH